jgi:hypothetical protein
MLYIKHIGGGLSIEKYTARLNVLYAYSINLSGERHPQYCSF